MALTVIATVYSTHLQLGALLVGAGLLGLIALATLCGVYRCAMCATLGAASWVALSESGVDPILIGTALGLLTPATPTRRRDLERVTDLFRTFREQPTPVMARDARLGLRSSISPNVRLQRLWHPWTSYPVVPLFALAYTGIPLSGRFLVHTATSPIVIGIVVAGVVGKPLGVIVLTCIAAGATGVVVSNPLSDGWRSPPEVPCPESDSRSPS